MCREKWLQGVGAFPDPAEQEDSNKSRGAGCPVLMCHFMACQNGYWVTPTHSVMKTAFSAHFGENLKKHDRKWRA